MFKVSCLSFNGKNIFQTVLEIVKTLIFPELPKSFSTFQKYYLLLSSFYPFFLESVLVFQCYVHVTLTGCTMMHTRHEKGSEGVVRSTRNCSKGIRLEYGSQLFECIYLEGSSNTSMSKDTWKWRQFLDFFIFIFNGKWCWEGAIVFHDESFVHTYIVNLNHYIGWVNVQLLKNQALSDLYPSTLWVT